jgi:uncharacterized membrane protein YdjX (TVP38/TMEM64 family)
MGFEGFQEFFTLENIKDLLNEYRSFGPVPAILLPFFEAFLPFLPLFIFVMANTNAFGLWLGFLLSWIGSSLGALMVFLLVKKYGHTKVLTFLKNNKQVHKLTNWVDHHGFGPIFVLLCFPFTPSAVVNVVAGLSHINMIQYSLAVLAGKLVMIFTISFVGYDIPSLIKQPIRTAIVLIIIFILWYVGKRIEVRLNKSLERHNG